uniref:GB1/RHD3-type G domain-containing protein n=1 Tax=Populus trichocarpa TaxID=3694 RepID=A0A3N7FVS2_POPTR
MKRLFKPRKKTLLFVIRDHSKTPLEYLKTALLEDIEKIWAAVAEPETLSSAPLREFFNVEITALPSYEYQEENFKEQLCTCLPNNWNSQSLALREGTEQQHIPVLELNYKIKLRVMLL